MKWAYLKYLKDFAETDLSRNRNKELKDVERGKN
jgi:hypothetical protein